jgi:CRISPR-associated protein Cmr4
MKTKLLYLFTRTPLHIGAGSSVGAIDQPIQRERHTGHPIIPGSSIKGVLRDAARQDPKMTESQIDDAFGPEDSTGRDSEKVTRAGNIAFTEARLIAFPVRSAKGAFAYVTCPFVLSQFQRFSGLSELPEIPEIEDQTCLASKGVTFADKKTVVLEEYCFDHSGEIPTEWTDTLKALIPDPVWQTVPHRLVILSDGDFAHFVKATTEISNHNRIDAKTGTVEDRALFNLESVPAESLFVASLHSIGRSETMAKPTKDGSEVSIYGSDSLADLTSLIESTPVLQFGGNSTTGRGFCSLSLS